MTLTKLSSALERYSTPTGFDSVNLAASDKEAGELCGKVMIELDDRFYKKMPNDGNTWKLATEYLLSKYPDLSARAIDVLVRSISYDYK